ncbi:MAG TPA: lipoyl synthase [Candidatus Avibacteroides avistercoris]|uniref:Lipoyl synthase n=1 Tax=Candidatus Avibacteroides avistercoris TaxID=2840690 RepID=A0A9D2ZUD8_9BACT|nr:lipoyl synthase [Candidatus Avibacteroides avistercoris]
MDIKHVRKPDWLKVNFGANEKYAETKRIVDGHCLHTICSSGRCPNIGECWGRGTATFMIGGDICTRACKFCNTKSGRPAPLDETEPANVARSVKLMKLRYAVITSVDRDDLPDLGASHWVKTISEVKSVAPETALEVLIPDFQGRNDLLDMIADAGADVVSHNIETVRRLTPEVRSRAKYETSLHVLQYLSDKAVTVKSGLMVGLGETAEEVESTMDDLLSCGCRILTIGQYLQPTHRHYPVHEYITPAQFDYYKQVALAKGFKEVESAPLVRSSYRADKLLDDLTSLHK